MNKKKIKLVKNQRTIELNWIIAKTKSQFNKLKVIPELF